MKNKANKITFNVKVLTPISPLPQRLIEVLARMMREFYSIPENLAAFEAWKAEEDAKKIEGDLIGDKQKNRQCNQH